MFVSGYKGSQSIPTAGKRTKMDYWHDLNLTCVVTYSSRMPPWDTNACLPAALWVTLWRQRSSEWQMAMAACWVALACQSS